MYLILTLLAVLIGASAFAQSQEIEVVSQKKLQPSMGVTLDPLWFAINGVGIRFEYFLTDRSSIEFTSIYRSRPSLDFSMSYKEISIGSNIMLTGTNGSRGLYVHPFVGQSTVEVFDYGSSKLSGTLAVPFAGATVGYQWVPGGTIKLAIGGGVRTVGSGDLVIQNAEKTDTFQMSSSVLSEYALDAKVGIVF